MLGAAGTALLRGVMVFVAGDLAAKAGGGSSILSRSVPTRAHLSRYDMFKQRSDYHGDKSTTPMGLVPFGHQLPAALFTRSLVLAQRTYPTQPFRAARPKLRRRTRDDGRRAL